MRKYRDDNIIDMLRSSDQRKVDEALKYLYKENYLQAKSIAFGPSSRKHVVQDMLQDALVIFYNQVRNDRFKPDCAINTYLYSICRNLWLKHLRKMKKEKKIVEQEEFVEIDEGLIERIIESERDKILADLFEKLGEDCRKVLLYFYYDRLKMKEIAEKMGFNAEQSAKNKKARCLNKLKKMVLNSPYYKKNLDPN